MSQDQKPDLTELVKDVMAFLQAGLFAGVGGEGERAAMLYGAGDRHFIMQLPAFYIRQLQPGIDAAIAALGHERYQRAYEQGRAMSVEEATVFLLAE